MLYNLLTDYMPDTIVSAAFNVDDWCYTYSNGGGVKNNNGSATTNGGGGGGSTSGGGGKNVTSSSAAIPNFLRMRDLTRLVKRAFSSSSSESGSNDKYHDDCTMLSSSSNTNNNTIISSSSSSIPSAYIYHGSPSNPLTPPTHDRDDWYNLRHATPASDMGLQMCGIHNETTQQYDSVRRREAKEMAYIDWLNRQDGYISSSALVHHHQQQWEGQGKEKEGLSEVERRKRSLDMYEAFLAQ